ncbi:MAG TPA: glycosyltransferase family 2 protein [Bacteroidales bacterium]|nr:glycosyltransferase family 2 protein [Bacteroidales bacterium]HOK75998.1 glycosyltransferase family 2 protein [Bacteroidales bacterium]HOM39935.1 glycosyltransferase family 2 protein [Bacteroidales bacterium]HOU30119.1 glycosyltransferase family 2 protein [Bacteroidales bacterium]HPP92317.1 glycosyltransferase family 2 protein [Bacteroidales bacterium]
MDLSVVIPVYNEEESLPELAEWIVRVCRNSGFTYEIIFIDDGSSDSSWKVIGDLCRSNNNIKGVSFRRNYGKAAALHTGFGLASGDVVITMDSDLQDSPDEIPELYRMVKEEGYDLVSGWKKKRYDPFVKRVTSRFYNFTAKVWSGIRLHDFNCGLKAYRNEVIKSIEVFGEMHRYIPILVKEAGFKKIGEKVVQHRPRKYGTTKYGLDRFIKGYLDLLTIGFITRFGKSPMHLFGLLGTLMFLAGFLMAGYLGGRKLWYVSHNMRAPLVTDSAWFYIALTVMVIGTLLFLTGFIGELVNRNSPERNKYLLKDKINA